MSLIQSMSHDSRKQHLTLLCVLNGMNNTYCMNTWSSAITRGLSQEDRSHERQVNYSWAWAHDHLMTTWEDQDTRLKRFINMPSNHPPGYKLERPLWCKLNRIRFGADRFNAKIHQLGYRDDPMCACADAPRLLTAYWNAWHACLYATRTSRQ